MIKQLEENLQAAKLDLGRKRRNTTSGSTGSGARVDEIRMPKFAIRAPSQCDIVAYV